LKNILLKVLHHGAFYLKSALNQEKACRLSGAKPFLESKLTKAIGAQMSLPPCKG